MNDNLLQEFINLVKEEKRDDLSTDNLIKANTKLSDENTIMKKELKKCYDKIDKITHYIRQLKRKTDEVREIYKIITDEEQR